MALLRFSIGEAMASLRQGWRSTAFAVLTVAGASFILALLLWVGQAAAVGLDRWAAVAEVSVYLSPRAPESAVIEVRRALQEHPAVTAIDYVSVEEVRERLLADFPDAKSIVEGMSASSVPASFEVRLDASRRAGAEVSALVEQVRGMAGVDEVRYDSELIDRVFAAVGVLRGVGGAVGLLLLLTCAMTITSVVKLAYESRRDEVEIMYLVGAPARAIRGPFAVEGLLLALVGATVALALLVAGTWFVERRYAELLMATLGAPRVPRPSWHLAPLLVTTVGALGLISGLIASGGGDGRRSWRSSAGDPTAGEREEPQPASGVPDASAIESDR